MHTNNQMTVKSQKQEAIMQLRTLLSYRNAKQYQKALNDLMVDFGNGDAADCKEHRSKTLYILSCLQDFFMMLDELPDFNRYKRELF